MARIVSVVGVAHNPFLPRLVDRNPRPPAVEKYLDHFGVLRERLRQARPDSLVVIASDHMHGLFTDNLPSFLIGKADNFKGIYYNETREWGLTPREVPGDFNLAGHLLLEGLQRGIDFAFSNEIVIDHGFIVPLEYLRPEMDLPIVPIFINTFVLPMPTARRCFEMGQILRDSLDAFDHDRRVAVIISGHLSVEVGGPRSFAGPYDSEFDNAAVEWIRRGDAEAAIKECTFERMHRAGNATHGFLPFITGLGLVRQTPADYALQVSEAPFGAHPFFAWDIDGEGAA